MKVSGKTIIFLPDKGGICDQPSHFSIYDYSLEKEKDYRLSLDSFYHPNCHVYTNTPFTKTYEMYIILGWCAQGLFLGK